MVEVSKPEILDELNGTCVAVEIEPSQKVEGLEQYHIEIEPEDKSILKDSKTGRFHEWIRITPKTSEGSVPEGSVIHRYIQEIEGVMSETKKMKTVKEVFEALLNKKFKWKRKKLGKSYSGHEATEYWCPVQKL